MESCTQKEAYGSKFCLLVVSFIALNPTQEALFSYKREGFAGASYQQYNSQVQLPSRNFKNFFQKVQAFGLRINAANPEGG